jgi:hypothetical protein
MFDSQFEDRLKENAEAIFGQEMELPVGHRERFEQRLKEVGMGREGFHEKAFSPFEQTVNSETVLQSGKVVSWKTWLVTAVAVAAVLAGFVFVLNPFAEEHPNTELANVRNYYSMLLGEQVEATRQLILQVDENHRETLLTNVDFIENESIPDILIPDDEYIIMIASFYSYKIETLQNIQDLIIASETTIN